MCCLVVMFFRFVTSGEIRKRSEFFEPFILGLTNASVEQVRFSNLFLYQWTYVYNCLTLTISSTKYTDFYEHLFLTTCNLNCWLFGVNSLSFYLKIKTQFCKSSVEPMGEESDHVQIIALSDALGVPIRVVYLDRSSCENNSINVNHHDFVPTSDGMGNSGVSKTTNPSITLLYRPGHYDILYPKWCSSFRGRLVWIQFMSG